MLLSAFIFFTKSDRKGAIPGGNSVAPLAKLTLTNPPFLLATAGGTFGGNEATRGGAAF
jgi:hypothetical protein